ncbi:MAG: leucyl aminopeptidase [Desulfatiglans sp.]|jgi:leucyl aminopeptidase|nr:leucyl aminopeptidase [Thermodesulfobacteriota bacterium]MEE4353299.1 leucyl aminopeptidase [Desulfatiglans sp.]
MLRLVQRDVKKQPVRTLVIPVCEDKDIHEDPAIQTFVGDAMKIEGFKGSEKDHIVLFDVSGKRAKRVMVVGMGKAEEINHERLRSMTGRSVKQCLSDDLKEVLIAVPSAEKLNFDMSEILESIMEGGYLANHVFDRYKSKKKTRPLKQIDLLVDAERIFEFGQLPSRVEAICGGTILAREWVDTPSNDKRPQDLAKSIASFAEKEGLNVDVLDEKALKKEKFGAMLSVAAGSKSKPRMVLLEYCPAHPQKTIALVGKGVTFDSGGINLKPTGSLKGMKSDMAGAAAVAATILSMAKLKSDLRIIAALPIVENMPSGSASRPGDIIKSYHGKTVEIGNTDAEGRLILIDAMSYVLKRYNPNTIIDVATLTGACVVGLGEKIAGVFSKDDELAENILLSGERTFERCWRMPLPEDYKDLLKSDLADISNISSSQWGGAITAALFLSEFVGDTPWAHIDIAGPAFQKKENAYNSAGATGFGVRLLCNVVEKL